MDGEWQLVFEASEKISERYSAAAAVAVAISALVAIGLLILWDLRRPSATDVRGKRLLAVAAFGLAFLCVWTSLWWFGTSRETEAIAAAAEAAPVVEGVVEDFHPMPYTGHAMETFDVQGVHFEYSMFVPSVHGQLERQPDLVGAT